MRGTRGSTIVSVPVHSGRASSGLPCCCCCRCCTCFDLTFLKSGPGLTKLAEVVLGFFCQSLTLKYGYQYSGTIGLSLFSFISIANLCFSTTLLLLICYMFSRKSINLIKSSLYEVLFNTIAAISYLSSCSYLGYIVNMVLEPVYVLTPHYEVYPAMSAVYTVGSILGFVYAYDAYKSYRYFKGYRY